VTAWWCSAEIVIEGEDAVDLGSREIQSPSDMRQRFGRHEADAVLNRVQNHEQRSGESGVLCNRLINDGLMRSGRLRRLGFPIPLHIVPHCLPS